MKKRVVVVSFIKMEQYQKQHFVDISKHIETLPHLPVVTREDIKMAIKLQPNSSFEIWTKWNQT